MVKFYVNRIKNDKMQLEDVPIKWREEVKSELEQIGMLDVEAEKE